MFAKTCAEKRTHVLFLLLCVNLYSGYACMDLIFVDSGYAWI